jgi:uncharacterized protein (DUF1800 family)
MALAGADTSSKMRGPASAVRDDRAPRVVPRRSVLKGTAVGGTLVATGSIPHLLSQVPASAAGAGAFVSNDPDLHLLRRATWGVTPKALKEIRRLGRREWLERQLDPDGIGDGLAEDLMERFPRLQDTVRQVWNTQTFGWDWMFDLGVATLARACWSRRQLFEVMVDFWSNHLNVTNPSDNVWHSRHDYDVTVIRAHALGRFSDMLAASARHPAMMLYLNNAESTFENPNENYGRELLELHSVGVDGGYDEDDMRASTLVMTGFGFDWDTGEYEYHPWAHHVGRLRVMDWSSANADEDGEAVGLDYVDHLAHHPSTARHIATKLVHRFVSDSPRPALVEALAETYLDHDTAIVPVLRKLFRSNAYEDAVGEKVRRPLEDLVATVRALRIKPDPSGTQGLRALYWMAEGLGHAPLAWGPPNGYPDDADSWRSAGGMLGKWNAHIALAAHWWPNELVLPPLERLLPSPLPGTHGGLVQALAKALVFRRLSRARRDAVLALVGRSAGDALSPDDAAVGWRLPYLVSSILDSPYHAIR